METENYIPQSIHNAKVLHEGKFIEADIHIAPDQHCEFISIKHVLEKARNIEVFAYETKQGSENTAEIVSWTTDFNNSIYMQ